LKVARRLKDIGASYDIPKSIHGFVQRTSSSLVEVTIFLEEPVLNEHILPILTYAKSLQVAKHDIQVDLSSTDALAIESLSCKFKVVRNKPEQQEGFSRYEDEDYAVDDAFSMVTSIHRL
jgi:hypothetical protein